VEDVDAGVGSGATATRDDEGTGLADAVVVVVVGPCTGSLVVELGNCVRSGTWFGVHDAWAVLDVAAASVVVHGPGDLKSSPELTKGGLDTSCTVVGTTIFIYCSLVSGRASGFSVGRRMCSSVGGAVVEWLLANRKTCSSKITSRKMYIRLVGMWRHL
jgi:hypothetical protein